MPIVTSFRSSFVEVNVLHIVLDNPHFVRWPLIGPQCESFQTHHAAPTRLLTTPWFASSLAEHHGGYILVVVERRDPYMCHINHR